MSCAEIFYYGFCSIKNQTVFEKTIEIEEASNEWELKMKVYSNDFEKTFTVETGEIERVNDTTWKIKEHIEELPIGKHEVEFTYYFGTIIRTFARGIYQIKKS